MVTFQDRIVLVTGASSGLGRATAIMLGARGAHVLVAARRTSECEVTAAAVRSAKGEATVYQMDVADGSSIEAGFAEIRSRFGRLDAAFNNAGVSTSVLSLHEARPDETRQAIEVNLVGTIECIRQEIAIMREGRRGSILNNSSMAGVIGYAGLSVYSATKHALVGLTKSAAMENAAFNIRVNCICPGPTMTEMVRRTIATMPKDAPRPLYPRLPMRRMGRPEEVAEAACFLLSDAASFITGAILPIDGGESCSLGEPDYAHDVTATESAAARNSVPADGHSGPQHGDL